MRAKDFVTEIERLRKDDYTGGKDELEIYKTPGEKKLVPLPGNRDLSYSIRADRDGTRQFIFIVDPNYVEKTLSRRYGESVSAFIARAKKVQRTGSKPQPKIVAKLSIEAFNSPIPNAVQVGSITVDEDYRGRGLARALYGIVLYIMKKTLVAGNEQTPGGRRNWMSLASIPGVEVKGYVQVPNEQVTYKKPSDSYGYSDKDVSDAHDNLMNMGGQYLGKSRWSEYWAFDVMPDKDELKQAIKTPMNTLYDNGEASTGMFAVWTGK